MYVSTYAGAVGLVVKYLVANEMPRVRFPDGAFSYAALFACCQNRCARVAMSWWLQERKDGVITGQVDWAIQEELWSLELWSLELWSLELWWTEVGAVDTAVE